MKWIKCSDRYPSDRDQIIVKLDGCKMDYTHAFMYVRDAMELPDIFNEWRYADNNEKNEFGKIDCAYLTENKEITLE